MTNFTALYPGTFDPLTRGHEHVILTAKRLCGRLILGLGSNPEKAGKERFSISERVDMAEEFIRHNGLTEFCSVVPYNNLLVDFAAEQKADFLIRGIRGTSDVDSEYALNCFNKTFNSGLETVFLMPPPNLMMISSTFVWEAAKAGKPVHQWVNPYVEARLRDKFRATDL
jgi:pantetheine-phosphate adenylyltransferase